MTALDLMPIGYPSRLRKFESTEEFVCWSRMQAEAGQQLDAIISRKERERRAGGGLFCWGVGNAPALVTSALARLGYPVMAVFSIMKSKPKPMDVAPASIVAWRKYLDANGVERPLPPHVLVTSRGPKGKHFALMCWSDTPLTIERGIPFDPKAYRNAGGTGAPVASSQVTALLKKTAPPSPEASYEANIRAWLTGSYWVRLTDSIELSPAAFAEIAAGPPSSEDWIAFVNRVRHSAVESDREMIPHGYLI
jgi:hypothetical protein